MKTVHHFLAKLEPVWTYLTANTIAADTHLVRLAMEISAGLVVGGVLMLGAYYLIKRFHFLHWLATAGSVSILAGTGWLVLFWLRFEDLAPFDRRIWTYLWFLPVIGFAIFRAYQYKKHAPNHVEIRKRYEQFEKYLPKPKKT